MSSALLMCFLSVAAGTMVGYYLFKKEYQREKYFQSLIDYCNCLVADIRFSQRTIAVLTSGYVADNPSPLTQNLNEYIQYVTACTELKLSKGYLKPSEYADVSGFFKSLGTFDGSTQILDIENYKNKFILYKERQSAKVNKHAKNYIKLGFLFGLALGIMLI